MTETRTGGTTIKVLPGRAAAPLLRYKNVLEAGQEPYLFDASRHCSLNPELQILEFKATREEHGTDGAMSAVKARHEAVDKDTGIHDNGQRGTHVREYTGGRYRMRSVRDSETPTHLRIEPDELRKKQSEAVHSIYAAGADLVNSENTEDCIAFFEAVVAERAKNYPGIQESIWAERNGKSGLLHVHVASNATIYKDFTRDGVDYRAGQKMAGKLTKIDETRKIFNQFLRDHPEHGFQQSLADVGTQTYKDAQLRSGQKDHWDKKRGKESNHDKIRRVTFEALGNTQVTDQKSFISAMASRGIEVSEVGLRRGVPSKSHDYRYRLTGATQWTRGTTLGTAYKLSALREQFDRKSQGLAVKHPDGKQHAGAPRPMPFERQPLTQVEMDEVAELDKWIEDFTEPMLAQRAIQEQAEAVNAAQQERMAKWQDDQAVEITAGEAGVDAQLKALEDSLASQLSSLDAEASERAAKVQAILDNPPAAFKGLSEEELVACVDANVIVRNERLHPDRYETMRMGDVTAMTDEHDLTRDEASFLVTKWESLDLPQTSQEKIRDAPQVTAEVTDVTTSVTEVKPEVTPVTPSVTDVAEVETTSLAHLQTEYPTETGISVELLTQRYGAAHPDASQAQIKNMVAARHQREADAGTLEAKLTKIRSIDQANQERAAQEAKQAALDAQAKIDVQVKVDAQTTADAEATERAQDAAAVLATEQAQVGEQSPWRSGLRDLAYASTSERIQARIDGLAQLEEDYRGRKPDATFQERVTELGVGPQFLNRFRDNLDPKVREHLEQRLAKQAQGKRFHEEATAARTEQKPNDVKAGLWKTRQVRDELKAGDYAPVSDEQRDSKWKEHTRKQTKENLSRRVTEMNEVNQDRGEGQDQGMSI